MPETKKPCKIICFRGDRGQCWLARISLPMRVLWENYKKDYEINITGILDTRYLDGQDLIIMQRQYKPDVYYYLMKEKAKGVKLIYECDDDMFTVPKWNSAYNVLGKKSIKENVKTFVSKCDAVFTTTEQLAKVYGQYCEKVYVLPNSLDFNVFSPSPRNSKKKVVLWAGSDTHKKDVEILRPAMQRLVRDEDVFVKFWKMDVGIPEIHQVPFVPLEAYYSMLAQVDAVIGLSPLVYVPFNKSKSNIKFLEYTAQGMATIASNFGPYADTIEDGETGILIDNNRDWYDKIRFLLENDDERNRLAENALKLVKEEYDIQKNYILWKNAIDEVMQS